jgi:hypothetical protein
MFYFTTGLKKKKQNEAIMDKNLETMGQMVDFLRYLSQ